MFYQLFFSFSVEMPRLPLSNIVSWTSNHAPYDVYSPKVVETATHNTQTMLWILFSLLCVKYIFFSKGISNALKKPGNSMRPNFESRNL